ncbi:DUF3426 domain-containing protein [Pseudomonas sp. RIT-PI-S]|uniref:DUF3426 domain-containing protein n=1 Tax=Pseudomonas sp. RIT-PI-S TaxID=3035295 RepID=UPI0021DAE4B6|nr:DUF3426 domain-containing protein [Pseudomonas sp. RIT-PI-S]
MTESFVTQCPHCRTSFKVSHNQLSVARGAVRCGACKQVFNAARQLLEQSAGRSTAVSAQPGDEAPVAPTAVAVQPPSTPEWPAHGEHLEHLDLDQELARLERRPGGARTSGEPPSILSAQRDQAEDWLDELFGNHQHAEDAAAPEAPADARQEPRLGAAEGEALAEEDPLADLHQPLKVQRAPAAPPELLSAEREDDASLEHAEDDDEPDPAPARTRRSEPELREDHLLDLQDDPLQLQWQKPQASSGKRLLWAGLTLLAALALLAQYVVFHFDELARQDSYRPWFVSLCPSLGCSVPSRVDIQLIRSSNLVVRSHPTFAGALVVDAIIYNRASFSQPFPLLELRFADLNNKLIASRRFKPSEYLSGDLAGQSEMPPQVPIHIALDILDPGKRAVNYSLSFHSPE